jgi:hypothetical protein
MDDTIELSVEVPAEIRLAVERAAAAQGISVSDFIEQHLKKMLTERGFFPSAGLSRVRWH